MTTYAKKLGSQITNLTNENNKLKTELDAKDKLITKLKNFVKKNKK